MRVLPVSWRPTWWRRRPGKAYEDARTLVERRPGNGTAHYSLAYVLRYVGQLERAQSECQKALAIDPRNYNWRFLRVRIF